MFHRHVHIFRLTRRDVLSQVSSANLQRDLALPENAERELHLNRCAMANDISHIQGEASENICRTKLSVVHLRLNL
jgi:hypothetical protein